MMSEVSKELFYPKNTGYFRRFLRSFKSLSFLAAFFRALSLALTVPRRVPSPGTFVDKRRTLFPSANGSMEGPLVIIYLDPSMLQ